jgi:hypothetical protein
MDKPIDPRRAGCRSRQTHQIRRVVRLDIAEADIPA